MADPIAPDTAPSPPSSSSAPSSAAGGCLRIFILGIILTGAALFGTLKGIQYYSVNCQGMLVSDCLLKADLEVTPTPAPDNTVVSAAGPYEYKGHTVAIVANIPLSGGNVTGTVSGECHGKVTGTYDGRDQGVISGNLTGYCDLAIIPVPAQATFGGTVNKRTKIVPISFDGSAAAFTHSGSLTLTY